MIKNQYENKIAEQVWDNWNEIQRGHFLKDHFEEITSRPLDMWNEFDEKAFEGRINESFSQLPIEYKNAIQNHIEEGQYGKGGMASGSLEKELHKLQRDLNSSRLLTYREGDNSEEEMARQRERAVKLARFNEVLRLLKEKDGSMATGGIIKSVQDFFTGTTSLKEIFN